LLREGFDAVLPPEDLEGWMAQAQAARQDWLARGVPIAERRPLLLQTLDRLYRESDEEAAAKSATELNR
jgi:acyl-CoA reductase-like NAD-dependent aldehyde dehydrogenase